MENRNCGRVKLSGLDVDISDVHAKRDDEDFRFAHDLMKANLSEYFDKYTEGWNDELFHRGYLKGLSETVRILRLEGKPIGFFDVSFDGGEAHVNNLHLIKEFQRGHFGVALIRYIERYAISQKARQISGKVFRANQHMLRLLTSRRLGYEIKEEIPEESSYLVSKILRPDEASFRHQTVKVIANGGSYVRFNGTRAESINLSNAPGSFSGMMARGLNFYVDDGGSG